MRVFTGIPCCVVYARMFFAIPHIRHILTLTTLTIHAPHIYSPSHGYGVAHFAKIMLEDKGLSLAGKKCLIVGSNYVSDVMLYAVFYILYSM